MPTERAAPLLGTLAAATPQPPTRRWWSAPEVNGSDATDPLIRQLREQLADNDIRILDALNTRLELVARLKRVKAERGIGFLDPAREEWLLQYLARANRGPLSAEGLRELYTELLDLTKREVERTDQSN